MSRNATQSFVAGAYRNATIRPSPITGGLFRSAILSFSATDQINVSFRWAGKTTGAGAPKANHNSTSDDLVQRLADIGLGLDDPRKRWRSFERFPAVLVCFESELGGLASSVGKRKDGRLNVKSEDCNAIGSGGIATCDDSTGGPDRKPSLV